MDEALKEYIEFVNEQVKKYKKYTNLIYEDEISPITINTALANYGDVHAMLLAEYNRKKTEAHDAELQFQKWWDDKICKTRKMYNREDLAGVKWLSIKEIMAEARNQNSDEYIERNNKLFKKQSELKMISDLLEMWKSMDNILVNLSVNTRSEMKNLSIDKRLEYQKSQVSSMSTEQKNIKVNKRKRTSIRKK